MEERWLGSKNSRTQFYKRFDHWALMTKNFILGVKTHIDIYERDRVSTRITESLKKRRRGSEKENDQKFFNKVLYIFLKLIIFYVENIIFFFVLKKCCFRDFPSTLQIHLFKAIEFRCINFYRRNFGISLSWVL